MADLETAFWAVTSHDERDMIQVISDTISWKGNVMEPCT